MFGFVGVVREHVRLVQFLLDLADKSKFHVLDQAGVGHDLEVLLDAELGALVDVLRSNVYLLVVAHDAITFSSESAAILFEVATQLHQVKNGYHAPPTHPNEVIHERAHGRLAILAGLALPPLPARVVFVLRNGLLLGPEDL